VLDRALLHHQAIRYRAHAQNASSALALAATTSPARELPLGTRQRLSKSLGRARKAPSADGGASRRELAAGIEGILRERDER
jgi:hypothetical protein